MKISYISLRKKFNEFKKNKKESSEKENNVSNDDTKFIGINFGKNFEKLKKYKNIEGNMKKAPKGSYTLLIFMVLLLVITTRLNINTYKKLDSEEYEIYGLEEYDGNAVEEVSNSNVVIYQEAVSSVFDKNEEFEETVQTSSSNVIDSEKDALEEATYVYEYTYVRPVKGDTLKEYSMDKVIYSKTLDMWKVHDGIDIYADIGEEVIASEKGIVERVYEDSFYGYSVIIDHQNGIKTIYRNLSEDIVVKEKQEVEKETVIGKVGDTAIGECKDESHIHFEVVKDNQIVNPNIIGVK